MSVDGKDERGPKGEIAPEDRETFRKRSEAIGRRLDEVRHRHGGPAPAAGTSQGAAMGRAMRVSAELMAGILVGGAIGWGLDSWLGLQKPWFRILFFLLGAAAGIMNVVRSAMREKTPPSPSVKDDEDEDK